MLKNSAPIKKKGLRGFVIALAAFFIFSIAFSCVSPLTGEAYADETPVQAPTVPEGTSFPQTPSEGSEAASEGGESPAQVSDSADPSEGAGAPQESDTAIQNGETPTDDGEVPAAGDTDVPTDDGEVPAAGDTDVPTDDGEVPAAGDTEVPADDGEVPAAGDTEVPTDDGEVPAAGDTEVPADDGEVPAAGDTDVPTDDGEVPAAGDTDVPTDDGEVPAAGDTDVPTGDGEVPADEDTDVPTEGEVSTGEDTENPTEGANDAPPVLAAAPNAAAPAAEDEPPTEPEPSIPEDQVDVEAYAIPAGSAYIHEISKEYQYNNSANSNAITDALTDALTYLRDLYDKGDSQTERVATIVVQDGTYEGGVSLSAGEANNASVIETLIAEILGLRESSGINDDFTIRVVAHDAIVEDDSGQITEINANSEGNVKIEGGININVEGLTTILAGLFMSTQDAIVIDNADGLEYYGTKQDDVVTLYVSNNSNYVWIDSGWGNDTVTAEIKKKPNLEASVKVDAALAGDFANLASLLVPGSGSSGQEIADALKPIAEQLYQTIVNGMEGDLDVSKPVNVGVRLGGGEDKANIKLIDASDIVASILPDDQNMLNYGFALDMSGADMDIEGGEGDDQIAISGGRSFTFAQNLLQAVIDLVNSELAKKDKLPATEISVIGGEGDDVITVDTTTAFATWGDTSINTDGSDGFDRLHITGKLNDEVDVEKRIQMNTEGTEITIEALAQITILSELTNDALHLDFTEQLRLAVLGMDSLTDQLENKRTIAVEDVLPGDVAQSFTNYLVTPIASTKIIKDDDGKEKEVDCEAVDFSIADIGLIIPDEGLLFSNIVFTNDFREPISGRLDIRNLQAEGLNVVATGETIDIAGPVTVKNLILAVYGEDAALAAIEEQVIDDDLNEGGSINLELGIYSADREIGINIEDGAYIRGTEAVDLQALLVLDKPFIPGAEYIESLLGKDFNPVTIKLGTAGISIYGSILAGGYVHAQTDVDVTIDASNQLLKAFVPVALAVSSGSSSVVVGSDAVIRSGYISEDAGRQNAGILLSANSSHELVAYSHGGSVKFSIALSVVEFETLARITGNAVVDSGSGMQLLAKSVVDSTSYATGKPSIVFNVSPQSGVFIAGNFIFNETRAIIDEMAEVLAQGDVTVDSLSDVRASTVTMAIPLNDMPVSEQLTPFNVIPFVEKLIGVQPAGNQTMKGKLLGAVTGSNSLGNLFTDATKSAVPDTSFTQVMGALGVAYVKNDNLAKIDTAGKVSAGGKLNVHATGNTKSYIRADGSLYRTPSIAEGVLGNLFEGGPYLSLESVPKNAIGAAIAVDVFLHSNEALIAKGVIEAVGLSAVADSQGADSSLIVKAGHTPTEAQTKLGIGGAIAVHVANVYNTALVKNTADYDIHGGDVEVLAGGHGSYVTVADASGKRTRMAIPLGPISIPLVPSFQMTAKSAGVGAGIAVEVINIDTLAQIEDKVSFGENKLNSLNVNAAYDAKFYIEAAAGATGGVGVAPVVALTVSGVNTKALVGKLDGVVTQMPGEASVTAHTLAQRNMTADAKAVGSRGGAGAAVGLSIIDDSAIATLSRSIKAASVDVSADSVSRIEQIIYASSQGATPNPIVNTVAATEVSIKQFIALFTGQGLGPEFAQLTDSMKSGSADNMTNKNAAALSGLTGSLGAYSGKAGTLTPDRIASLAEKRPKLQTTEGSVQVAATIAANVQSNKAKATISDGLSIEADGNVSVTAVEDTDAVIFADSTASNSTTGVGVAAAVNYVEYENIAYMGAKSVRANDLIVRADIVENENLRSVQEILAELINYLADTQGIGLLTDALLEEKGVSSISELIDPVEFERLFNNYIDQINEGREGSDKLSAAEIAQLRGQQQEIIEKMVIDMLVASLQDNTLETASTLMVDIVDSIVDEFFDILSDPNFLLSNVLGTGTAKQRFDQFIAEKGMLASISFDMLREAVVSELTVKYGNPSELDNMGNRISTSAVSGAGGANVGIAGSLALSLIESKAQAIIADLTDASQGSIELAGTAELYSQSANKIYTTASSSAANNGLPEKNKTGKADSSGKSVGVGASFAMANVDARAESIVGANRVLKAAALSEEAIVHNDIDTVSVAGQDPIGRQQSFHDYQTPAIGETMPAGSTSSKDIAVDASAALNIIQNTVNALVREGARLTLTGGDIVNTTRVIGQDQDGTDIYEQANLYLLARQRGQTYATASGFASGGTAAVGASVAVNLAQSDVNASLSGSGSVKGAVTVDALTLNEDEAQAFALTYGTSLDRYFEKIRTVLSIANFLDNPQTGYLNAMVVGKINQYASPYINALSGNIANSPLMALALSALGIQVPVPSTNVGNTAASGALAGTGAAGQAIESGQETSTNIAAAVGVNVTGHKANATINGDFEAKSFDANAESRANYRAYATGATIQMDLVKFPELNSNVISAGVAVSVNENEANAILGGRLNATGGDVSARSTITQNLDDKFAGLLAAQSLAGAFGGSGAGVGLAGAVSVVKSGATGTAQIMDGSVINGEDIVLDAVEKSKIAVRAGGVMAGGQSVGLGAAFGMVYDSNNILARVGDNSSITGSSLSVNAQKLPVTSADYQFPFDLSNLFTVSNGSNDDVSPDNKGLIHINITDGSDPNDTTGDNSLEVNLSTERVLSVIDMLNYLASVNYYIEAISGSITAGPDAKAALTGGFAVLYAQNSTSAEVGDNVVIVLNGGEANVKASTETYNRIIGGSLAATGATGVGVNVAGYDDTGRVNASIGNNSSIRALKDANVHSSSRNDILTVTVAASLSTGGLTGGAAVGGTVDVVVTGNEVTAAVGDGSSVESEEGSVSVLAESDADIILVSVSASGAGQGVAAGGTFAVLISGSDAVVNIGEDAVIIAAKDASVRALSEEDLIKVLASVSGAASSSSAAGTIGVLVTESNTIVNVGHGSSVTAREGAVSILADGDVKQVVVQAAAAGSGGGAAAGAAVSVNVFEQTVAVRMGDGVKLLAENQAEGSNVTVFATGKNQVILVNVAGAAASTSSIAGVIPVVISQSTVETVMGESADVEAGDSIAFASDLNSGLYNAAGAVSISMGSAGVGATVSTMVVQNRINSSLADNARLIAHAVNPGGTGGVKLPNRDTKRRGVMVSANANTRLLTASVSGAVSGTGVAGVVNTLVFKNNVNASVGENSTIEAGYSHEGGSLKVSGDSAEVAVEADDESELYNFAGSIGVGTGAAGVGASVVSMVYDKSVNASIGKKLDSESPEVSNGLILTTGSVNVAANSNDDVYLVAVSFAGGSSAAVGVGANALVFENDVSASLDGKVEALGDVSVTAESETDMINAALALSISGTAAVSPVAVVTWFEGSTEAVLNEGADISAGGDVKVQSDSREFITSDAAGVSVSGTAAVSGTVDIIISQQQTRAQAEKNVSIDAANISLAAFDDTQILGIVATAAASGTAAVGVNAMVSVLHNTVSSGFAGGDADKNIVNASGNVDIKADALRDIRGYAANVAGAGVAGVGATVMVNVAGGKLSQDSSDSLLMSGERLSQEEYDALSDDERKAYDENARGGFDPDAFLDLVYGESEDTKMSGLSEKLQGDGVKQSDIQLGDDEGNFDAETGYVSGDFNDESKVDIQPSESDLQKDATDQGDAGYAPGEDFQIDESANGDLSEAGSISARPNYDPKSAVSALIGQGVHVTAGGNINVLSAELVNSDMIAATAAGGVYAGVGAGVAVNVLYSNVVAGVDQGAVLDAGGDISVKASSGTEELAEGSDADEKNRNDMISGLVKEESFDTNSDGSYSNSKTSKNKLDITSRTIRSIAVTGAGGVAGVSVSGSVIMLSNNTIAYLDGDVTGARNLSVEATANYPQILSVTGAVSGGIAAVTASFAVVYNEGSAEASIGGSSRISDVNNIKVETNADTRTTAVSAAVAGGAVGVNAGVAVAINRVDIRTYIADGVSISSESLRKLDVHTKSDTVADVWLMSIAGGGVAAGLSGAVSIVEPTVYTYIGVDPGIAGNAASAGGIHAPNAAITVKNDVSSQAKPLVISVAGSATASVTGTVLLSFNNTDAIAGIIRKNITASTIEVDGNMDAAAEAIFAGATVGNIAVGISVAYVQLEAGNEAILDVTGVTVKAGSVGVYAGRESDKNSAVAEALSISANIGPMSAVSINAAIAHNAARNLARITGAVSADPNLDVSGAVNVLANSIATAKSDMLGLNIGTLSIAASASVAVLGSEQKAVIEGGNIRAGSVRAISRLNEGSEYTDTSRASILTGGGGLVSVKANVAVAYGRSSSIAGVAANALELKGGAVDVLSTGNAGTKASVKNQNFGVISAGVVTGYAYSQGVFDSHLLVGEGDSVDASSISVRTNNVNTRATTELTPSAAGVKASYASIDVNLAIASARAAISSRIAGKDGKGGSIKAGSVTVLSDSESYTNAVISAPVFSLDMVTVAANVLQSLLTSRQEASISDVNLVSSAAVTVSSNLNEGIGDTAKAQLGGTGLEKKAGGSATVSMLESKVNYAEADSNAKNYAFIKNASVDASSALTVEVEGRSDANAFVGEASGSVNLAGIGVNVVYAKARGDFKANIELAGDDTVSANSIKINNKYTTIADAVSGQPTGGVKVDVSALSVDTNTAYAVTATKAESSILGKGKVVSDGALEMSADGTVTAFADVPGTTVSISGISIAVNLADATVDGFQKVSIENADVTAGSTNLNSYFNRSLSGDNSYGAKALVGSNGSSSRNFSLNIIGGEVSLADAEIVADVQSLISGATLDVGSLNLLTFANVKSLADVRLGSSVSVYNVTVLETRSDAAGSFIAKVDTAEGYVNAGNTSVRTETNVKSQAMTGTAGGLSSSIVNVDYNEAEARTGIVAQAIFGGHGMVRGDLTVEAIGDGEALAKTYAPTLNISAVSVAVNKVSSRLNATQEALVNNTGDMTVTGAVKVSSVMNGDSRANVDGPTGNITAISADVNESRSYSDTTVKAGITSTNGLGKLSAGIVDVDAKAITTSNSTTSEGVNVSLASFGKMLSEAYSSDNVEAFIEESGVSARGNIDVDAQADTEAVARATAGVKVGGLSADRSQARSYVGSQSSRQTVKAYIGDNASLEAEGDISVKALNTGYGESIVKRGLSISLAGITNSSIYNDSWYDTYAGVGSNSRVYALGDVSIEAEDSSTSRSEAVGSSIGFGVSASDMYGRNRQNVTNKVEIKAGEIFADGDVIIQAISNANMRAYTRSDSSGVFADGDLQAKNELSRLTQVDVLDGARIESDFGDVKIVALAGQKDKIVTEARLDVGGFTGFSNADTTTKVKSESIVNIKGGAEITDTFGTVHIEADASMKDLDTYSKSSTRGLGGESYAWSNTDIDLIARTNVSGSAGDQARITGRYVEIHSGTRYMDIVDKTDASIKALGADVEANTNLYVDVDVRTDVTGAQLRGYDKVTVTATSDPSGDTNVYGYSKVYLGAIGEGYSSVDLFFTANTILNIGPNVSVYGADVELVSEDFAGEASYQRDKGGFIHKHRGGTQKKNIKSSTSIDKGTKFYIGDAAAGIVIDIYDRGSGTQLRHVGLEKERLDYAISAGTITIGDISNILNGYLTMDTGSGSSYTVFDQNFLPYVRIINRTDNNLVLSDITLENNNYVKPTVDSDSKITHKTTDYTTPEVSVESRGSGSVDVGGFIANPRGSVSFIWTDEARQGDLSSSASGSVMTGFTPDGENILVNTAPVWAHELIISGAKNVGENENKRFAAWLFPLGGVTEASDPLDADCAEANVKVTALGDVYLNLTPVRLHRISAANWAPTPSTQAFSPNMRTDTVKALGDVDILFGEGIRLYQKEGSSTVLMPLPGTFQYVKGSMVGLSQDVTIDKEALDYYLSGYDVLTGVYSYLLPNGTEIYTDEDGNILRIVEGGIDMNISDYAYDAGNNTIRLAEGVSFDLANGTLSVDEGYSFEALLSAVSGNWIRNSSGLEFAFVDDDGQLVRSTLSHWYSEGGVDYYYLSAGSNPDDVMNGSAQLAYIVAYNSGNDALKVYQLENNGDTDTSNTVWQIPLYNLNSSSGDEETTQHNGLDETYRLITMTDNTTYRLVTDFGYFDYSSDLIFDQGFAGLSVQQSDTKTYRIAYTTRNNQDTDSTSGSWKLIVNNNGIVRPYDLSAIKSFGEGFKVDSTEAAKASNEDVRAVYNALSGVYWKLSVAKEIDRELSVCVPATGDEFLVYDNYRFYNYTGTISYTVLNEVGLTMADGALSFTPGSAGSLTIEGEASGVQFKENDIPTNSHYVSGNGYRITDSLYLSTDGKIIMFKNKDAIFSETDEYLDGDNASDDTGVSMLGSGLAEFAAIYDLLAKTYASEAITVSEDNKITLRERLNNTGATQNVMRESITGFEEGAIATDIMGNYYLLENGQWKPISKANISTRTENGSSVIEIKADDGTRLLTIETLENGEVFITLKNGTIVGSDGSVEPSGAQSDDPIAQIVGGTDYILGHIEGATVKITMPDPRGSLIDGNDDSTGTKTNIIATEGDAVFVTESEGSIGTGTDPLEIIVAGDVVFVDLDKKIVLKTDTYLEADSGDIIIADGTVVDDSVFHAVAKDGSVIAEDDFSLINESEAELIASEDVIIPELILKDSDLIVDAGGSLEVEDFISEGSTVDASSGEDTTLGETELTDSEVTVDAGGSLDIEELISEGSTVDASSGGDATLGETELTDSEVTVDAGGSLDVEELISEGSTVDASSGGDATLGETELTDSEVTVDAGGSLDVEELISEGSIVDANAGGDATLGESVLIDSELSIEADGDISADEMLAEESEIELVSNDGDVDLDRLSIEDSSLNVEAGEDISFDIIEAEESDVSLESKDGDIIPENDNSYIRFSDSDDSRDEKLSLGAENGDIASEDRPLLIDTDDTLLITKVDDYYIDFEELVGEGDYAGVRPVDDIRSGWDEEHIFREGDYLGHAGYQTVYGELKAKLAEEISKMLTDRLPRDEWMSLLEQSVQESLVDAEDEEAALALTEAIENQQIDLDVLTSTLEAILTTEDIEDMLKNAWEKADYEALESTRPDDPKPRSADIEVGEATGAAYVTNDGDINITQQTGDLTAGRIISDRGDVTLRSENGGIEGEADEAVNVTAINITLDSAAGVGANTALVIEQRDNRPTLVANLTKPVEDSSSPKGYSDVDFMPLDENGQPTSEADKALRPADLFALESILRFDWLRVEYPEDATKLTVTAAGDVNIEEKTGDLGVDVIEVSDGDLTVEAPGSIIDSRDDSENRPNISVTDPDGDDEGDAHIISQDGSIGTSDDYLVTDVEGTITAEAEDDISVDDKGDLDIIVQSDEGQVNANADGDLDMENITGDLVIGRIEAEGTADIESQGDIVEGDRLGHDSQVEATDVILDAQGDIGTEDKPFLVDTDSDKDGTLSAEGDNLYIEETDGDLILEDVDSTGDTELTVPGSILDGNANNTDEAVDAQKEANKADAEADKAEAEAYVQNEEAQQSKEELDEAEKALEELKNDPDASQKELDEAEKAYQEALDEYNKEKAEADEAQKEAEKARDEAERLQQIADDEKAKAENEDATVSTGGDLELNAGESVGEDGNGLSVDVDGTVDVDAQDDVHINGKGDLELDDITVDGDVDVNTIGGDIRDTGDSVIDSGSVDINALDGDVGSSDNPITTNTDQLDGQGENVYIENQTDTNIGNITADDELVLDSQGDVTGTGDEPDISAGDATINADGDIGTKDDPLDTNVDNFHGEAEDIYIDNHSQDLDISDVDADSLHVDTDGNVTGEDITVHNIDIDADGYVGKPDDPFEFWADGYVSIRGGLGSWWRNLYVPQYDMGINLAALLVLRFELSIDGESYTLYALIGITEDGKLMLLGFFITDTEPDEEFWNEVFRYLKEKMNIREIGLIVHSGENKLETVAAELYPKVELADLETSPEGELLRLLEKLTEEPEAVADELESFSGEVSEKLAGTYADASELMAELDAMGLRYTLDSDLWFR